MAAQAANAAKLADGVLSGCRVSLSRAITMVESTRSDHAAVASHLLERVAPAAAARKSYRVGVSGAPGAGKSSLIEKLGMHVATPEMKVAVLTVDPSSALSKGSILGDKTRMEGLAQNAYAYVRPSPSGGVLGGLSRRTDEAIVLCEAAGFDLVIVETVGVGQSESAVADAVDLLMLLVSPAAGDDLQGSKKGVLERADLLVVNKADGALLSQAITTARDYRSAVMFPLRRRRLFDPQVVLHSVSKQTGQQPVGKGSNDNENVLSTEQLWELAKSLCEKLRESGELEVNRSAQRERWMWSEVANELQSRLLASDTVASTIPSVTQDLRDGLIMPRTAGLHLVNEFLRTSIFK